jgi:Ca2+-binding EF-hand superfamily protein
MTQQRMVRAFQKMDRDGSGTVTTEEITAPAVNMFERMDRNNDDKVDQADMKRRMGNRQGNRGGRYMQQQPAPAPQAEPEEAPNS